MEGPDRRVQRPTGDFQETEVPLSWIRGTGRKMGPEAGGEQVQTREAPEPGEEIGPQDEGGLIMDG